METEAINKIQEYLHQSTAYLSIQSLYARGYKDGILCAKEIIADILRENGINESYPN